MNKLVIVLLVVAVMAAGSLAIDPAQENLAGFNGAPAGSGADDLEAAQSGWGYGGYGGGYGGGYRRFGGYGGGYGGYGGYGRRRYGGYGWGK